MIYLNGEIAPASDIKIDPSDRGFLLADGLFETMRVSRGQFFFLQDHWQRLLNSACFLGIPLPITLSDFEKIAQQLLKKNNLLTTEAGLRLTLTRGSGPRGLLPLEQLKPTLMIVVFHYLFKPIQKFSLHIATITRKNEQSPLANIKSLNYLDHILARIEAQKNGADEAVLLNTQGKIAGGSAANLFCVTKTGDLATPRLKDGALPGITRQKILQLARQVKLPVKEISISVKTLLESKAVFVTNSLMGVQPAHKVNEQIFAENTTISILQKAYSSLT